MIRSSRAGTPVLLAAGAMALFALAPLSAAAIDRQVPGDHPTIQEALQAATSGDRILVAPGSYTGALSFGRKDVVVESTGGAGVTQLDALGSTALFIGPGGAFRGFSVVNARPAVVVTGAGTLIEDNVFDGALPAGSGVALIAVENASPELRRNLFRGHRCFDAAPAGVITIRRNASPVIANNLFEQNDCRAVSVIVASGSSPLVVNNSFVGNRAAVRVNRSQSAASHVFRNNLLYANGIGLEVDGGSPAEDPTWENNLVFANGVDYESDPDPTGQLGNLRVDPLLVDPGLGDFHLQPGSPAIDAGSELGAPSLDLDGNARPQDGDGDGLAASDIGAFEAAEVLPEVEPLLVEIDVMPWRRHNRLRLDRWAFRFVAVLGSEEAPVEEIDPASLAIGPDGAPLAGGVAWFHDVDRDGFQDLLGIFHLRSTGLRPGDTELCVEGKLGGEAFMACDAVEVRKGRPHRWRWKWR